MSDFLAYYTVIIENLRSSYAELLCTYTPFYRIDYDRIL